MNMTFALCALAVSISLGMASSMSRGGEVVARDVEYTVAGQPMQGYLARPKDMKPGTPGVIVVQEWWGLNDHPKERARMIAEQLGYAAFCPDMYGKGKRTDDPKQAQAFAGEVYGNRALIVERVRAGIDQLTKIDGVDKDKLAAIGFCFGGMCVLECARDGGVPFKGVVSFHGSLGATKPAEPGAVKAKVLVCHGADDPMVGQADVKKFEDEMRTAKADFKVVQYPGAVHAFTNPKADGTKIPGVKYDKSADEKSWAEMTAFLQGLWK